jgi:nicotinate dehydrogenase subunit A
VGATFRITVNGVDRSVDTHPDTPLLTVLRNDLGLTGARFWCGMGLCGACFVRIDGAVVASCDVPVWSADGRSVVTVEGLADGDELHPVQRAILDTQAAQCGYCVSGIAVSAAALLDREPHPSENEIAAALDGNLCRCGVQRRLIRAVLRAAEEG